MDKEHGSSERKNLRAVPGSGVRRYEGPRGVTWQADFMDGKNRVRRSFKTKKEAVRYMALKDGAKYALETRDQLLKLHDSTHAALSLIPQEMLKTEINRILGEMFFHNPEKKQISPRMRQAILLRDGERCQRCGADAKETKLHVDHIEPFSMGGLTIPQNLQTLCQKCNGGKSNIFK